ncbi:S1C family serine protease [Nocardioides mangrovicus]|uniref:S1C family serine protease n=1 Tax=Nocardioides mangrovicus TaxID=2478913 RepID=UPI001314D9BB|nr:trypsin-like peptidase domain-containing protein [Nocardioides mangrovicus]
MSDQEQPPGGEWTSPSTPPPPAPAPTPAAPAYQPPTYPLPPYPYAQPAQPVRPTARTSGWVWPVVALVALLVGLVGGVFGGLLAGRSVTGGDGSGGVLRVEKRTAAPLPANNRSVASVAQKLLPSTVQIIAEYDNDPRGATGSGFVLDRQGHVITNNHVVAAAAKDDGNIEIVDQNGTHSKATVVGRSSVYDVAVLKCPGCTGLTPAKLGSSTQMRVGETVIAFGSPLGLSSTVTSGIVSALDRPVTTGESQDDQSYINAVQTDAAINPGNSGGPLVDLQGQVIGMNSAIASMGSVTSDQSGSIGVGFAIPIEQVEITADQILRTGRAEYPVIGANVSSKENVDGAQITGVSSGEPASAAGLRAGDLVTKVDGKPITDSIGLVVAIRSHVRGDKLDLTVKRDGTTRQVTVTLSAKADASSG